MAKKGRTGSLGLWAFVAIVLNAVAWLLKVFADALNLTWAWVSQVSNVLTTVSSLALTIIVLLVSHDFAERQSLFWRVLYWILAIATICAILFGFGHNFTK